MENLHHLNIAGHILAGSIALILGIGSIVSRKGGKNHIKVGRCFVQAIAVVILTGLIGVFIFRRNNFLLIITLLSGYTCFGGVRTLKLRGQHPQLIDVLMSLIVMTSAFYYLYYINSIGLYWSPVIIYSTLGALLLITLYDVLRIFMPVRFLKRAVMYEHTYKMISSFTAICSAFGGTVLPHFKPYSQFMPSVMGIAYIFFTFIRLSRMAKVPTVQARLHQAS